REPAGEPDPRERAPDGRELPGDAPRRHDRGRRRRGRPPRSVRPPVSPPLPPGLRVHRGARPVRGPGVARQARPHPRRVGGVLRHCHRRAHDPGRAPALSRPRRKLREGPGGGARSRTMRWIRRGAMAVALAASVAGGASAAATGWPQWGGPTRDFKSESRGLAASWPASGPKELWSRPLGEGYSGIAVESGVLYTQYRPVKGFFSTMVSRFTGSQPEVVTAIDASSGKTLWEHVYEAPILSSMDTGFGPGPNSTPLVAGDLVFAVGSTGKLHALEKTTGRVVWKKDLWGEMGGQVHGRGYAPSPLAYADNLI